MTNAQVRELDETIERLQALRRDATTTSPSVQDVYGGPTVPISERTAPKGYRFTGEFREPDIGEWFLSVSLRAAEQRIMRNWYLAPRLILEPAPTPTVESVYGKPLSGLRAPEGWEFTGEFREVKAGDVALDKNECWQHSPFTWGPTSSNQWRLILRKRPPTPTIESVYGRPLAQLTPPKGWRWARKDGEVEFSAPQVGEYFLSPLTAHPLRAIPTEPATIDGGPRLILKRAQRLVYDVIDANRTPTEDEYGQDDEGWVIPAIDMCHPAELVLSAPRLEDVPDE